MSAQSELLAYAVPCGLVSYMSTGWFTVSVAYAHTEHWSGKADTVGRIVVVALALADAVWQREGKEEIEARSVARADVDARADDVDERLGHDAVTDTDTELDGELVVEREMLALELDVRVAYDAVPEAVRDRASVHVTVFVGWLEADTVVDEDTDAHDVRLGDDEDDGSVLCEDVDVRVGRYVRECEYVAVGDTLRLPLGDTLAVAHALVDTEVVGECEPEPVLLAQNDTEAETVPDPDREFVGLCELVTDEESDGESDRGFVDVPQRDTVGEMDMDSVFVPEMDVVPVDERQRLGVLDVDMDIEGLEESEGGVDRVGIDDFVTSPVTTVGVYVAEKPDADAVQLESFAIDCVTCVEIVRYGDTEVVEDADVDSVSWGEAVSVPQYEKEGDAERQNVISAVAENDSVSEADAMPDIVSDGDGESVSGVVENVGDELAVDEEEEEDETVTEFVAVEKRDTVGRAETESTPDLLGVSVSRAVIVARAVPRADRVAAAVSVISFVIDQENVEHAVTVRERLGSDGETVGELLDDVEMENDFTAVLEAVDVLHPVAESSEVALRTALTE